MLLIVLDKLLIPACLNTNMMVHVTGANGQTITNNNTGRLDVPEGEWKNNRVGGYSRVLEG